MRKRGMGEIVTDDGKGRRKKKERWARGGSCFTSTTKLPFSGASLASHPVRGLCVCGLSCFCIQGVCYSIQDESVYLDWCRMDLAAYYILRFGPYVILFTFLKETLLHIQQAVIHSRERFGSHTIGGCLASHTSEKLFIRKHGFCCLFAKNCFSCLYAKKGFISFLQRPPSFTSSLGLLIRKRTFGSHPECLLCIQGKTMSLETGFLFISSSVFLRKSPFI